MGAASGTAAAPRASRLARLSIVAAVAEKFRGRPDSEHEMTINRIVIAFLITGYLVIAPLVGDADVRGPLVTSSVFAACSVGFFVHILLWPAASVARRVLAMVVDLGMLSWGMHVGNEITSLLYPMYLWTIFGNGFRFGVSYLYLAMLLSVAGFSVVVVATDYWWTHFYLAGGLLAGLIVLPLYAATLIRKLSAARQQAEEASRAKSRFLASVSHELRTPLNAIIGLSDLLRDSARDPEQHEMTRTIGTAGRSLLALINSLLDFSRIEERHIASNLVEFDLHALLAHVRAILLVPAQAKSVRVAVHVTTRTPRLVTADKRHLEEILLNLGGNAVKFTERGYVVIAVDATAAGPGAVRLRCEVSDTGIGIAEQAQGRIFESFSQADDTIMDRFGGTGLGLAIAKELVAFHHGTIGVDSVLGAGSTFWFEMDMAAAAAARPAAASPAPVVLLSSDARLHELLAATGADIGSAATPELAAAALAELVRQGVRRPVAVVDVASCGGNVERAASMLHDGKRAHAPALVLAADAPAAGMVAPSLRSLFVTVVAKPVDAESLGAALAIARGEEAASGDKAAAVAASSGGERRLSVLVAEDNRTNQMVIGKILERAGHRVHVVGNGEAALEALDAGAFDVVLMDVNMPVMNGIEATKLYRFAALGSDHVPIIALTADATAEARERCEAAGMDACLTKPIEPARLLAVIENLAPGVGRAAAAVRETVTRISEHPRYQGQCFNRQVLDDLEAIGGETFVAELVAQFTADAASMLDELAAAAAEGNAELFRDRAHALRSGAANIGAQAVYEMCLGWRQIGAGELAANGAMHIKKLGEELDRVGVALAAHVASPRAAGPHSGAVTPLSRPA